MREVLIKLMELQKIDTQLLQLENTKGDLPQLVRSLEEELLNEKEKRHSDENQLKEYHKEKSRIDTEIKEMEGRMKKYQDQLYKVKNNREYDAVTQEIELVKAEIGKRETRLLELMDLEKEVNEKIEQSAKSIESLEIRLREKKKELEKRLEKTEKDEIALQDQRDKVVRKIEPRILSAYNRIRKAKKDLAVVPVIRNGCGGCYKTLPPQRVLEVREMNRLYYCEVCGRILVWDEEKANAQL